MVMLSLDVAVSFLKFNVFNCKSKSFSEFVRNVLGVFRTFFKFIGLCKIRDEEDKSARPTSLPLRIGGNNGLALVVLMSCLFM